MNHDHSAPSPPWVAAFLRGPFVSLWLPLVTTVAATLAWAALPANSLAAFVAEGGPVENATAVLYGFAMAAVVVGAWPGPGWKTPAARSLAMTHRRWETVKTKKPPEGGF